MEMELTQGETQPSVLSEAELLNRFGELVARYVESAMAGHVQENSRLIEVMRARTDELSALQNVVSLIGAQYKVSGNNSPDTLSRALNAAKRQGHDEGFLFGLRTALQIVVEHGNPTSAKISEIIADFDNNREK